MPTPLFDGLMAYQLSNSFAHRSPGKEERGRREGEREREGGGRRERDRRKRERREGKKREGERGKKRGGKEGRRIPLYYSYPPLPPTLSFRLLIPLLKIT